ncbi:MAG: hypothetical protein KGL56_06800 [Alphaproteobacteria bacterium]|nr:hypothetical protein [Alphaproteobacteria bacterium]
MIAAEAKGRGHRDGVIGVERISDKLMNWGWDGAICFWSLDGKPSAWPR